MTVSRSIPRLSSEFDNFLFSPIGNDGNGLMVSVLSALARLDVDPWQEAASLARLPRPAATERLVSLIDSIPNRPFAHHETGTIAARLIALLPRQTASPVPPLRALLVIRTATRIQAVICLIVCVIMMASMLGAQLIEAAQQTRAAAPATERQPAGVGAKSQGLEKP